MSGKTRVFVSLNGDYEGTPTIVIEGMSFEEFLGKCASKLKVEKKLSRQVQAHPERLMLTVNPDVFKVYASYVQASSHTST
eukprot:993659-Amorphochlora_amoeboformis.AAC.1